MSFQLFSKHDTISFDYKISIILKHMKILIPASSQGKVRGFGFILPPKTITKSETMVFKTLKNSNDRQ